MCTRFWNLWFLVNEGLGSGFAFQSGTQCLKVSVAPRGICSSLGTPLFLASSWRPADPSQVATSSHKISHPQCHVHPSILFSLGMPHLHCHQLHSMQELAIPLQGHTGALRLLRTATFSHLWIVGTSPISRPHWKQSQGHLRQSGGRMMRWLAREGIIMVGTSERTQGKAKRVGAGPGRPLFPITTTGKLGSEA